MFKILATVTLRGTTDTLPFCSLDTEPTYRTLAAAKVAYRRFTNGASFHSYSNVRIVSLTDYERTQVEELDFLDNALVEGEYDEWTANAERNDP